MTSLRLHHVSIPVRDLDRSTAFYEGILGLVPMARPGFSFEGRWYGAEDRQIHLIVNPNATFRKVTGPAPLDVHFALATEDFDGLLARLGEHGYRTGVPGHDPKHVIVKRKNVNGWDQMFFCDPDGNTVEANTAPI